MCYRKQGLFYSTPIIIGAATSDFMVMGRFIASDRTCHRGASGIWLKARCLFDGSNPSGPSNINYNVNYLKGAKIMKRFDHNAYPKKLKKLTLKTIRYIIQDCREALKAMPDGDNAGYYADEINYCTMELNKRS